MGLPQIEVCFDIDANGILIVSATELGTGNKADVTITGASTLTKSDVETFIREAKDYAQQDSREESKMAIRAACPPLISETRRTLDELRDKLDPELINQAQEAVDKLDSAYSAPMQPDQDQEAKLTELCQDCREIIKKMRQFS